LAAGAHAGVLAAAAARRLGAGRAALHAPPTRLPTDAADLRHMGAILAHGAAAFSARFARLFRGELVRGPLLMRGAPAFAGDLTLLRGVHRREPTVALLRGLGLHGHVGLTLLIVVSPLVLVHVVLRHCLAPCAESAR